jgi:hypothetical protein
MGLSLAVRYAMAHQAVVDMVAAAGDAARALMD